VPSPLEAFFPGVCRVRRIDKSSNLGKAPAPWVRWQGLATILKGIVMAKANTHAKRSDAKQTAARLAKKAERLKPKSLKSKGKV
jgi:hypothetical protein